MVRAAKADEQRRAAVRVVPPERDCPPLRVNVTKVEKRHVRAAKHETLLGDPVFKQSLDTLSREKFKKFVHEWALPRYQAFGGWNSLLSTAICMYDRMRKAPKNHTPLPPREPARVLVDEPF